MAEIISMRDRLKAELEKVRRECEAAEAEKKRLLEELKRAQAAYDEAARDK